ncbi:MAG: hypothetical protein ACOYL9_07570 [Ilumatobacteraceae bacterium]
MHRRTTLLRLAAAFVIGFVGLTLEIAYTRIISFKLFYYYTYFVIGLALLGLGAASTVVALSKRLRAVDSLVLLRKASPIVALVGLVSYAVVARLATDTNYIWAGSWRQALEQVMRLFVLSLSLTAVFFALGIILASLVVVEAGDVRRLYFWDLVGAALGCLLAVPLQATIGPPAMVFVSMVALGVLGLTVAAATRTGLPQAGVLAVVVLIGAFWTASLNVRTDGVKTLKETDTIVAGDWGPVFRVDAVDLGELQVLHHDGLWGSSIWRYDGTPATTARFDTDNRKVPFAALGREPDHLLIIGAAGGNEIQGALTYGVGQVDAVELNPVTVDLLRDRFAEYSGNIANNPKVNYVQGDGRTFLARSDRAYDMVWFVAPDSYAASNAATSGAFVLSESYLYTDAMIRESFDQLTPGGVMVVQFGDFDFNTRPTRTARYLVTARDALANRIDTFSDHVVLLADRGDEDLERVSTIMVFKSPVTPEAVTGVQAALQTLPKTRPVYLPGVAADPADPENITRQLITGTDAEVASLVDDYRYDISTVTDNKPFFWHFTPYRDVLTDWSRGIEDTEIAIGERLLLVLFIIGSVFAGVMLWLPFAITRRRGAEAVVVPPGRGALFAYFGAIGVGFMLVEISMIQRFALLLGYPTLSLSVSLFTLLIATAVGARGSRVVERFGRRGLPLAAVLLWVVTLLYLAISGPITTAALAWSQPFRIALVVLLLFPVGLILGLFLPTGIDAATAAAGMRPGVDQGRLVAWCWAVNGFFSVLGSSLTTMLSMSFGFNRTVLVGLILYVVATVAMSRMPSRSAVAITV